MDGTGGNTKEEVDSIIKANEKELAKVINRLVRWYTKTPADREDAVQVGWGECVRLARHYNKDKHKPFPRHAYKRVASVIARYVRQEEKHRGVRREDFVAPSDEQKKIIRDIVTTKLDPIMLEIVTARFYDGAKVEEIALKMGLTVAQVKWKLKTALLSLKKEFIAAGITGYDYTSEEFTRLRT